MLYTLLTRPETVPQYVYAVTLIVSLIGVILGTGLIGYFHLREWIRYRRTRHRANVALRAGVSRHLRGIPVKPQVSPYKYRIQPRSRR